MKSFNVVHHDGAIRVKIDDVGFATLDVVYINDDEIVVRAINAASRAGAVRGVLFTGDIVDDQMARMHVMRTATGTTWLGGKVTRLDDGELGPCFRIDWDSFPFVTEKKGSHE
jgi:hypothetical protein